MASAQKPKRKHRWSSPWCSYGEARAPPVRQYPNSPRIRFFLFRSGSLEIDHLRVRGIPNLLQRLSPNILARLVASRRRKSPPRFRNFLADRRRFRKDSEQKTEGRPFPPFRFVPALSPKAVFAFEKESLCGDFTVNSVPFSEQSSFPSEQVLKRVLISFFFPL